jgi:DNA-binding CsgD family transcriptional regulator
LNGGFEEIIGRIYEAAVIPEVWPSALHEIGEISGARGAILLTANPAGQRWISSPDVYEDMAAYEQGEWHLKNKRLQHFLARQHAGFLRDVDIFPSCEAVQEDPQIKEFFRPRGLGWGVGTTIPVPSGDFLVVSIERDYVRGPIENEVVPRLDALRPHLARAALMSARLHMERAKAAVETIGAIGLPAAVVRRGGALLTANAQMQALVPHVLQDGRDRARLVSKPADALLARAFAAIEGDALTSEVTSIPVAATEQQPPMIVHLVPVRGLANDIFSQGRVVMVVTPVIPAQVPGAEVLQGLFDLSPAEARVARGIGGGSTVEEIAGAHGISRETVRTQLKSVLSKTGLGRQVELAQLLAGKSLPQV